MEKLTLEHTLPFVPHGVKFRYKDNGDNITRLATIYNIDVLTIVGKPILRPTDLTKPIQVEGKEVIPYIELLGLFSKEKSYLSNDIHDKNIGVTDDKGLNLIFTNNVFILSKGHTQYGFNSLKIWKWLYANKFDVDGLIDAGLAIDVNTLETNPYE